MMWWWEACVSRRSGLRFPFQMECLAVWFSSPIIWLYLLSWRCGEANSLWLFFLFVFNLGMWLENRRWLLFPLNKDPLTMHELEFAVGFCRAGAQYIGWLAWDEQGRGEFRSLGNEGPEPRLRAGSSPWMAIVLKVVLWLKLCISWECCQLK